MIDLHNLTIFDTKKKLKEKEFSAVELAKSYLERIKNLEPKLNAFVTVNEEKALEDAKRADKLISNGIDTPLLGIPFSIKDNYNTKNVRTTASSKVLDDYIPPYNATVVEKLQNAGIVMLGKTNLDAWAHGSSTETSDYGVTHNPWDLNKLPGGSSGGAGASLSADECMSAIGSETAGSVRIPASWCGNIGFKPTYGRVSRYGLISMASSTDSPGPHTKTVEEAAFILEILAGKDEMDATTSSLPVKSYTKLMKEDRKIKIGISEDYFNNVDKEIVDRVNNVIKELEKKGNTVKKVKLFDPQKSIDVYTILQRVEVSSNLARMDGIRFGNDRSFFQEEAHRRIMLGTFALSHGYNDEYYTKAKKVRTIIINDFNKAFEEVDVILGPTTPVTALPIGATKDNPMFGELMDVLAEPSSIAGLCAISVPIGFDTKGLPMAMQIIGNQFEEEKILNLAYQYEKDSDFRFKKPNL